jgi:AcrR family transcriptional regulator
MSTRRYDSPVRDEAAAATRASIVRATVDLAYERGDIDMTLQQIAERARTTVRTIMRQFGSRDAVIEAGIELGSAEIVAERHDPGGDVDRSIALLVEHYERKGAFVLRILAQDQPGARRVADTGRHVHWGWVEEVFGPRLPTAPSQRTELVDLLVVATDIYAWKLLRLDRGLGVVTTSARIRRMTQLLIAGTSIKEE